MQQEVQSKSAGVENSYLWPMLKSLPYFRALLRAVEASYYQDYELPSPVLDIGCGDGHFASLTFDRPLDVGIDPSAISLREAQSRDSYQSLIQSLGDHLPFASNYFSTAISNSVLEHIPGVRAVLIESGRVLKPGALLLFCVPNHNWAGNLKISAILDRLSLSKFAKAYRALFIKISRHVNMFSPQEWQALLEEGGFEIENYWHYFSPKALHTLELGHYFGLPSQLSRWIFGHWIISPSKWNLGLTYRLTQQFADTQPIENGTYTWIAARKR